MLMCIKRVFVSEGDPICGVKSNQRTQRSYRTECVEVGVRGAWMALVTPEVMQ